MISPRRCLRRQDQVLPASVSTIVVAAAAAPDLPTSAAGCSFVHPVARLPPADPNETLLALQHCRLSEMSPGRPNAQIVAQTEEILALQGRMPSIAVLNPRRCNRTRSQPETSGDIFPDRWTFERIWQVPPAFWNWAPVWLRLTGLWKYALAANGPSRQRCAVAALGRAHRMGCN